MKTDPSAIDYLRNLLAHSPEKKLPRREIMQIMLEAGYTQAQIQYAGTSSGYFNIGWTGVNTTWSLRK